MKLHCLILAVVVMLLGLAGCTPSGGMGSRFEESQVNSNFRMTGAPFDEYVRHMRLIIAKTRQDLTQENRDKIISANSPFEWKPSPGRCPAKSGKWRNGILLIHGLSDSPFQMHDIGRHFLKKCYLVRAILLPGHGTVPGDLLQVEFKAWVKAANYGIQSFKGMVDNLYVAGFSTGGTLAIYHALRGANLRALILFSPAVKIASNLGFMANWHKAVSWANTDLKWMDVAADEDYAKYESFTFNAADQIYLLTKKITLLRTSRKVNMPMFIALSADDATVDSSSTLEFFQEQNHPESVMLLYTNGRGRSTDKRIRTVEGAKPGERILDYSHLSIHLAPDNPHYGAQGDYSNCLHYLKNRSRHEECKSGGAETWSGEVTEVNLKNHTTRRLTYNPRYQGMVERLNRFLKKVDPASN